MARPNVNWTIGTDVEKSYVYGNRTIKAGIPFAQQVTEPDMKYIIKYDFSLGGAKKKECVISGLNQAQWDNPAYVRVYNKIVAINAEIADLTERISQASESDKPELEEQLAVLIDTRTHLQEEIAGIPSKKTYYYETVFVPENTTIFLSSIKDEVFLSESIDGASNDYYKFCENAQNIMLATEEPLTIVYEELPTFSMPNNCILEFDGGTVSGGCLIGNNTTIKAIDNQKIFPIYNDDILLTGSFLNAYATPNWFWAAGNAVDDDTLSFQRAADMGADLYIPGKSTYLIKGTIYLRTIYQTVYTNKANKSGSVAAKNLPGATIVYNPNDGNGILFKILDKIHDITFLYLDIVGTSYKGTIIDCSYPYCDKDINILNTKMSNIGLGINFTGRGCTVRNCIFHGKKVFVGNWNDSYQTGSEPAENGQRGYIFSDNRFHVTRNVIIDIQSGHARGLVFTNNLMDFGRNAVIHCVDEAWNWNIQGNTFQYAWGRGTGAMTAWIVFEGGINNSIISGNIFECKRDERYFSGTYSSDVASMVYGIELRGGAKDVEITNNLFRSLLRYCFLLTGNLKRVNISGNICSELGYRYTDMTQVPHVEFIWLAKNSTYPTFNMSDCNISNNIIEFVEGVDESTPVYNKYLLYVSSSISVNGTAFINNRYTGGKFKSGGITVTFDGSCIISDNQYNKGTFDNKPANSVPEGFEYYCTDLKKKILYNDTGWTNLDGTPLE